MRTARTTRGVGSPAASGAAATTVGALAAALLLVPGSAAAQEGAEAPEDVEAPEEVEAPEIAEAPLHFRIGLSGSAMRWEEADERRPSNGSLWGPSVERVLFRYLGVRLDAAYGTGRIRGAADTVDVKTYLAEVALVGRIAPPALDGADVVPFVTGGIGSLVHDPDREGLPTASQNALSWGLGVEALPLDRLGVRAEWRRYDADLENVFDALDRSGVSRRADRFQVTAYWTF